MKSFSFSLAFAILAVMVFSGCNKESYIENVGYTTTVSADPANNTGTLTFWSSNASVTVCSAGLRISVDGAFKGSLSENSYSSINCGAANSKKALTLILSEGSHTYTANGSGSWCPKYSGSVTVKKGYCIAIQLQ